MSANTMRRAAPGSQDRQRLILPVVLLVAGVLIILLTPFQVIDAETDPVGPRFVPYLTGAAVALGGLVDLITQLRAGHRTDPTDPEAAVASADGVAARETGAPKSHALSFALVLVGILVWVYTTVSFGYAVTSLLLMGLTAAAFGLRKPVQIAVLLVVTVGLTYVVFAELLQVQLTLIGR